MSRTRLSGTLVLALALSLTTTWGPPTAAATVTWPTSTLVISEVQTGGTSASDEFVEVANQGVGPVDLLGLEVVYATSSGSTVTRKGTWSTSAVLEPGRRILLANGAGIHAAAGDLTYTGGFAATGGAVALRVVGGDVIDSLGWGDAANPFVEGTAAPAPAALSSLERRPGGPAGNGLDSNDNAADFLVSLLPGPQGLSAAPVPAPGTATPGPTATPSPAPTPSPTLTPDPTPSPTATPSPSPTPAIISIADARALPDDAVVTIAGTLSTGLGALEDGRTAFVQDGSAGIALYLDAAVIGDVPAGTSIVATGTTDARFSQRTLRLDESAIVVSASGPLPAPLSTETGAATEALEGQRLMVSGTVVGSPSELSDGTAVSIDDGTGAVRVIVVPDALGGRALASGQVVTAVGPLGQRDSTGTGIGGYRLFVIAGEDVLIAPPPTPSPTPSASPSPTPTPAPSGTPVPTASPGPSTSPSPSTTPAPTASPSSTPTAAVAIASARSQPIGASVTVRGVVTAETGRLGTPPLLAIADSSAGIIIRLPDGVAAPARGTVLLIRGPLADPYGQLEIRPTADGIQVEGTSPVPVPSTVSGPLGERTEGRLVTFEAIVETKATKATSGDISFMVMTADGATIKVSADASTGIATSSIVVGSEGRFIGVVGQRASKKGALDGYRLWVRDDRDLDLTRPAPSAGASTPKPTPTAGGAAAVIAIAAALQRDGRDVTISGVVTAGGDLLDSTGRRIVVQDPSAAVEVLVPTGATVPRVGDRVRVSGEMGTAYGSPRLRAAALDGLGRGTLPAALAVRGQFTAAHRWRLVRIEGRVDDVARLGDRWRAEISVGSERLVVIGQPGAGIPVATMVEGRQATILGIVRAAYPTATDRRATLLPRSPADVTVSGAAGGVSDGPGGTSAPAGTGASSAGASLGVDPSAGVPDADLADLAAVVDTVVRVGGLVVELTSDGFTLDDGTAIGRILLVGEAAQARDLIEPGDAINVVGRVTAAPDGDGTFVVSVDDPDAIVLGSMDRAGAGPPAPVVGSASPDPNDEASGGARTAGFGGGFDPVTGGAGLLSLVGIVVASIAVTYLRRRHARRLMESRVAVRLAALAGPARDADATP
jgi:uncharacterized protein YdeI (BOF family)